MNLVVIVLLFCYIHCNNGGPLHQKRKSANNQSLIIYGESADIQSYPSTALLRVGASILYISDICASSILSHFILLTAANCLRKLRANVDTIRVSIGSAHFGRGLDYYTSNYTRHPNYKHPEPSYNLGIIRTNKMYLDGIVSRAIVLSSRGVAENSIVTLLGWGATGSLVPAPSKVLKMLDVLVISYMLCAKKHSKVNLTMAFCVTEMKYGITSTTDGDSGGPVYNKKGDIQYGIILPTSYYGVFGEPTICLDVASHREWIDKFTDDH